MNNGRKRLITHVISISSSDRRDESAQRIVLILHLIIVVGVEDGTVRVSVHIECQRALGEIGGIRAIEDADSQLKM